METQSQSGWTEYSDHRPVNGRPLGWMMVYDDQFEPDTNNLFIADIIATVIALGGLALIIKNL